MEGEQGTEGTRERGRERNMEGKRKAEKRKRESKGKEKLKHPSSLAEDEFSTLVI